MAKLHHRNKRSFDDYDRPVVSFRSRSLNRDLRWLLKLNITFQGLQKIPFIILHHKMLQKVFAFCCCNCFHLLPPAIVWVFEDFMQPCYADPVSPPQISHCWITSSLHHSYHRLIIFMHHQRRAVWHHRVPKRQIRQPFSSHGKI